jgi:predicted metal-dependent phosphoesterase TrpH
MKIDLHCHTFFSKDGISSPKKLIETALKNGIDGIAITDHDTISGWREAEFWAKKLGAGLILGEEIKTKAGDILGLFLKSEIKSREPEKVMKEIKSQEGIVVIPHPFHLVEKFKDDLKKYLDLIDAIEVFNGRQPFSFFDKKAFEFAKKHNVAMVAGSDAHSCFDIGKVYTQTEGAKDLEEFKKAIFQKKTKIFGCKAPAFSLIFPLLAKIGLRNIFLQSVKDVSQN